MSPLRELALEASIDSEDIINSNSRIGGGSRKRLRVESTTIGTSTTNGDNGGRKRCSFNNDGDDEEDFYSNDDNDSEDPDVTGEATWQQQQQYEEQGRDPHYDRTLQSGFGTKQAGVLTSLPKLYEFLFEFNREAPENVTSTTNQVVDELDVSGLHLAGVEDQSIVFPTMYTCHIIHMLGLTPGPTSLSTLEDFAAVALALQHLNTGDGSVLPDLENLDLICPIRFSLELLDTRSSSGSAVDAVSDVTNRRPTMIIEVDATGEDVLVQQACSFIGAASSSVTASTSLFTGYNGRVQLSGASTSVELNDKEQYPYFGRTVPNDSALALTMVEYFRDVLPTEYVALLTTNDSYGISFGSAFQSTASMFAKGLTIQRFTFNDNRSDIRRALSDIKNSKYRYILAVMNGVKLHNEVMSQAYRYGLAGNGLYAWFFPDSFQNILQDKAFEVSSDLALAYQGAGMFLAGESVSSRANPFYERFLGAMRELQNPTDLAYLSSLMPEEQTVAPTEIPLPDDDESANNTNYIDPSTRSGPSAKVSFGSLLDDGYYTLFREFLDPVRNDRTAFTYDAAILIGLGACDALNRTGGSFSGNRHFSRMLTTSFNGVTGLVQLDSETANRLPNSTRYRLVNFVGREMVIETNRDNRSTTVNAVRFESVDSGLYYQGNWTQLSPFVFNDGTTIPPGNLPPVNEDLRYIIPVIRGFSLTLYAICIISAISCIVWTWRWRNTRVVRASQPFFLYLICVGVIILAGHIVTLIFDTGFASQQACSRACTAGVWLLSIGMNVIFSALFTKTYRINKIMNHAKRFRKVKVTVRQTLLPMAFSLTLNIIILTVMTIFSPEVYTRTNLTYDPFGRVDSSYGHCSYVEDRWYLFSLAILNVGILMLSAYQAYAARHLSTEFSESKYLLKALLIIILTIFMGLPVVALTYETPSAVTFIISAIITMVCMTVLLCIFLPKVRFASKEHKDNGPSTAGPILTGVSGFNVPTSRNTFNSIGTYNDDHYEHEPGSTQHNCRQGSSSEFGERIVTTKSARQLVKIICRLESELRERDRLLQECEERCRASRENGEGGTATGTDEVCDESEQPRLDESSNRDRKILPASDISVVNKENIGEQSGTS